jgi:DNA polymerase eta
MLLAAGAVIVDDMRRRVTQETGFTCSAGISMNKMLAKLCSGMHKPNQQTLLTAGAVAALLDGLSIDRLRGLGAELGRQVKERLQVETCGQLAAVPIATLQAKFGEERGRWLWRMSRGLDDDAVKERGLSQSFGAGKTFRGAHTLRDLQSVQYWVGQLAADLADRLERDKCQHGRQACVTSGY